MVLAYSTHPPYATSLLYQKLYRTENVSSVNMKVYITELVQHLQDALGSSTYVTVTLDVAPIELDVSQGVPLGLIINEIITNSFKYAFDQTISHPEIVVTSAIEDGIASLVIKDNGIGFSDDGKDTLGDRSKTGKRTDGKYKRGGYHHIKQWYLYKNHVLAQRLTYIRHAKQCVVGDA